MLFRSIEKIIVLLTQSKVAQCFESQSIPTMISNSDIEKTNKSLGKFLPSRVKVQSLHTLPNLSIAPSGDIAFNAILSDWGTKPNSHIILTAMNEFDAPVSNKTLT